MYASEAQYTASQILHTLRHEVFFLLLGAAFTTVGLVSAAFALLARKFTPLLLWFSLFSILYGLRLWVGLDTVQMMMPSSAFLIGARHSIQYLLPIPAIFYFETAGFLSKYGKKISYALTVFYLSFFFWTLAFGPQQFFDWLGDSVLIGLGVSLTVLSLRRRAPDFDYGILRLGLLVFVGSILCGSISSLLGSYLEVEPIGFAFFLAALGYVAIRRSLRRDLQLHEIQKELDVARRIQMAILPSPFQNSARFRVAARYVPMTSVAGDFYDFLVADENQAGLLIADVSGHGVPAALIASMVKIAASSLRAKAADPAALLTGMNGALCGNTQNQFVTAAYVYLDATSGFLHYSAAGHPPMLLLRNGAVTEIIENGIVLAAFPSISFATLKHPLKPGDRLVLYTDGIIEADDENQEEFGQTRLQALLCNALHLSVQEIADQIIQSVQQWSKIQGDDLTVLVCEYAGPASG
jgi:sigma-B regulation protein RsbU (phosphoserine phosphatase)